MNNGEQQRANAQDKWSQWLLQRRFGGDRKMQEETMKMLGEVRLVYILTIFNHQD